MLKPVVMTPYLIEGAAVDNFSGDVIMSEGIKLDLLQPHKGEI